MTQQPSAQSPRTARDGAVPAATPATSSRDQQPLPAPSVIASSEWGAAAPRRDLRPVPAPEHVAIHHTDTANSADRSLDHAKQLSRNIQQWHFERDWSDSGQQFTVSRGGHALEGRTGSWEALRDGSYFIEGAHVGGHNTTAIGIECEGNYTATVPPPELYATLVHLTSYICQQYGIPPDRILAHRQFSGQATECCGDCFVAKLPLLRDDVAATLATGGVVASSLGAGAPVDETPRPTIRRGDSGEAVTALQRLLNSYGFSAGTVDGIFGPLTERAVQNFQAERGLEVDGIVGPKTWAALGTTHQSC